MKSSDDGAKSKSPEGKKKTIVEEDEDDLLRTINPAVDMKKMLADAKQKQEAEAKQKQEVSKPKASPEKPRKKKESEDSSEGLNSSSSSKEERPSSSKNRKEEKLKSPEKEKPAEKATAESPVKAREEISMEPDTDEKVITRNKNRFRVAKELLDTEESYIKDLEMITQVMSSFNFQVFIQPLYKSKLLKADEIEELFAGIHLLAPYHDGLLTGLRQRIGEWNHKVYAANRVGDLFCSKTDFLLEYTNYVNRAGLERLNEYLEERPEVADFIKKCEARPEAHLADLESLLILPIQRIPRYSMLLQDILKLTVDSHPDFTDLTAGLKKIQVSADYVNAQKKKAVSNARLVQLKARLSGKLVSKVKLAGNTVEKEGKLPYIHGDKAYVPEGKSAKKSSEKKEKKVGFGKALGAMTSMMRAASPGGGRERLFIVLSDCLLVCEEREDSKTHKIQYLLHNVESLPLSLQEVTIDGELEFAIEINTHEGPLKLLFRTKSARNEWLKALQPDK